VPKRCYIGAVGGVPMPHRVGWLGVTLIPRNAAAPADPLVPRPEAAAACSQPSDVHQDEAWADCGDVGVV
jgi:hypothetical protein